MMELPPGSALARLTMHLRTAMALMRAARVLEWDQRTFMPPRGLAARASQFATLQRLAHAYMADRRMGDLIERAADEVAALSADSDEVCLLRFARREYHAATSLPEEFVAERAQTMALARGAWADAQAHDDFALFAPWLHKTVEQSRHYADYLGYQNHPFDALLALSEQGL